MGRCNTAIFDMDHFIITRCYEFFFAMEGSKSLIDEGTFALRVRLRDINTAFARKSIMLEDAAFIHIAFCNSFMEQITARRIDIHVRRHDRIEASIMLVRVRMGSIILLRLLRLRAHLLFKKRITTTTIYVRADTNARRTFTTIVTNILIKEAYHGDRGERDGRRPFRRFIRLRFGSSFVGRLFVVASATAERKVWPIRRLPRSTL